MASASLKNVSAPASRADGSTIGSVISHPILRSIAGRAVDLADCEQGLSICLTVIGITQFPALDKPRFNKFLRWRCRGAARTSMHARQARIPPGRSEQRQDERRQLCMWIGCAVQAAAAGEK